MRIKNNNSSLFQKVGNSIDVDKRLYKEDIAGSIAHVEMLFKQKIISFQIKNKILFGLNKIDREISNKKFVFDKKYEDIHMNIEKRLFQIIGEEAGYVHTARSRNDQVATDLKLYIRKKNYQLIKEISNLQYALSKKAKAGYNILMPGFTHMQTAQPITFGHHLLAYVEMLSRDKSRLIDCNKRLNENPLGSGALSGTSFPINRKITTKSLGFNKPMQNSLDAVSSRDFVLETISSVTICSIHLSRLAEEIVMWMSSGFNFIDLPDNLTTGSSIMPQKKNPDLAELIRGKTGRLISSFINMSIVMKGLPLAYSKDLQEDKEPTFDALENIELCLQSMTAMIASLKSNKEKMELAAASQFSTATDLADWLVQNLNIPFRTAHEITGKIVKICVDENITLEQMDIEKLKTIDKRINKEIYKALNVRDSVERKISEGGTSPKNVLKQANQWIKRLENDK